MTHIVFVHVGPALPAHLEIAAAQARRFSDGFVWLVASEDALKNAVLSRDCGLRTVSCESLGLSDLQRLFLRCTPLDRQFRDGFWLHTTQRFFYLERLIERAGLSHVVHLENDVMLYVDLQNLLPVFDRCYPGMAATFDAPRRCVPGFVYVRDGDAIGRLTRFIADVSARTARPLNDMALLAGFRSTFGPKALDTLPIVPAGYPHLLSRRLGSDPDIAATFWNCYDKFGSIFDAAAIGQYLGGTDPRNAGGADTTGFINETCVFDPSGFQYRWGLDDRQRRVPFLIHGEQAIRINNLHIHSKALERFVS